jgi:hypothetical protein
MADFEQTARGAKPTGLASEFWHFLRQNKKWWLLPIILVMVILGTVVFLSSTGAAPFIYTLF